MEPLGYLPENEEKARRIVFLLHDLFLRDDLKDDFVLKGGTALNLYHWPRPRLSVDIDLDFVGAIEQDEMLRRRSAMTQTLPQFARRLGYQCQTPSESYALTEWNLGYRSAAGRNDHIKIEVNWLCRSILLEPEWCSATAPWSQTSEARAKARHLHELCAGKMKALMERSKPRDLMDAQHLVSEYVHEEPGVRDLIILYGAAMSHKDLRRISVDEIVDVSDEEINSELWPLLHQGIGIPVDSWKAKVKEALADILNFRPHEREFLNALLDEGRYEPTLLFPDDPVTAERAAAMPELLWKAQNVRKHKQANK